MVSKELSILNYNRRGLTGVSSAVTRDQLPRVGYGEFECGM